MIVKNTEVQFCVVRQKNDLDYIIIREAKSSKHAIIECPQFQFNGLGALQPLYHVIYLTKLQRCYPYVIDEETEAERG